MPSGRPGVARTDVKKPALQTDIQPMEAYPTMTEATIRIMCPSLNCRRILTVPVSSRGKKVRCRNCGTTLLIPQRPAGKGAEPASEPSAPAPTHD